MRVTRLRLVNVKRHADLDLELAPGLTIVRGPNEAGKSTIQRGLELALFRKATATGQEMEDLRRWRAPADQVPAVTLEFEDEAIRGRLHKRFAAGRGQVELEVNGQSISDPNAVDQRLAELTGLPSERFFRSTASVRHQELAGLDRDEGALRDRLQMAMSGADRGTWAARRKLEEAIRRYRSEGAKNPGLLKSCRDRTGRLKAEVQAGETELARLERDRESYARARDARVELDERLARERAQLEASERAVALLSRRKDAEERYSRYRRAAELRDQIDQKEQSHPSPAPLPELRAAVERLRGLEWTISEHRAELSTELDLSDQEAALDVPRWRAPAFLALLLALAAVVTALTAGLVPSVRTVAAAAAAALAIAALLLLLPVRRQRRAAVEARRENVLRDEEIARRRSGRAELVKKVQAVEQTREELLKSLGLRDLAVAESLLAVESEHVGSIERLDAEFRGLIGNEEPEGDLAALRDAAAAEAEQTQHALAGMGEVGADPIASLDRYRNSVRAVTQQRERALQEEADARARVEQNPVDAEQVAARAEELEAERLRLASLERRLRIYEDALAALNAAEQATMKKAARYLEQRMGRDIERITGGRYRRVKVDENELSFRVWSPEREDWVDVRSLSQGTLDQVYLAARLGLVRQVTQHRRPPLVFDDPFVTFDDERALHAVALLKRMASDHQVIYLTSSDRYDAVADRVVVLDAPAGRDEGPAFADAASGLTRAGDGNGPGDGTVTRVRRSATAGAGTAPGHEQLTAFGVGSASTAGAVDATGGRTPGSGSDAPPEEPG